MPPLTWVMPLFQFTPLREGRPTRRVKRLDGILFQFTPLREGRQFQQFKATFQGISIHAPPRGATRRANQRNGQHHFNSRPSARGDALAPLFVVFVAISIHAPPRGATCAASTRITASRFQFTPLREGRRGAFCHNRIALHFNSRPSARGDSAGGLPAAPCLLYTSPSPRD